MIIYFKVSHEKKLIVHSGSNIAGMGIPMPKILKIEFSIHPLTFVGWCGEEPYNGERDFFTWLVDTEKLEDIPDDLYKYTGLGIRIKKMAIREVKLRKILERK